MSFFKSSILLILFIAAGPLALVAQRVVQRKQLFDYDWKFNLGDVKRGSSFEFDDQNWRTIDLPHDWSIEGRLVRKIRLVEMEVFFHREQAGIERNLWCRLIGREGLFP
jgi:hypothetical protein